MHDDRRGLTEAERCLRNVERLVDEGDGQLARLSLDFYGEEFEEQLDTWQVQRFRAIREKLAGLPQESVEDAGSLPPGMH